MATTCRPGVKKSAAETVLLMRCAAGVPLVQRDPSTSGWRRPPALVRWMAVVCRSDWAAALPAHPTGSPPPRHLAAEQASSCSSCMATTTRQQEQGRHFEASRARWRASCALTSSMKDHARLDAEGIQHPDLLRSRSTAKLQWRSASPVSTETGSRQRRHGRHGHGKG